MNLRITAISGIMLSLSSASALTNVQINECECMGFKGPVKSVVIIEERHNLNPFITSVDTSDTITLEFDSAGILIEDYHTPVITSTDSSFVKNFGYALVDNTDDDGLPVIDTVYVYDAYRLDGQRRVAYEEHQYDAYQFYSETYNYDEGAEYPRSIFTNGGYLYLNYTRNTGFCYTEFDSHGNWTKAYSYTTGTGFEIGTHSSNAVITRTITYY